MSEIMKKKKKMKKKRKMMKCVSSFLIWLYKLAFDYNFGYPPPPPSSWNSVDD